MTDMQVMTEYGLQHQTTSFILVLLMSQRVKVFIRPKPLQKEDNKSFVSIDYSNGLISLSKPNEKVLSSTMRDHSVRSFAFSKIFSPQTTQQDIYEYSAFSIIQNVLEGYNGTIFAYGQTGSGKTYSIMGGKEYMEKKTNNIKINSMQGQSPNKQGKEHINDLRGIIPRSFNQIITVVNSRKDKKHLIQCYFIEIYNENVHDLLGDDSKAKMSLKENSSKGLVIEGLKTFLVKSVEDLERYFRIGYKNRSIRHTPMNKESSRSHCIFSIKIEEQTIDSFGNPKFKVGRLNLVDLAGSERQSKTSIKQQGLKQATKINLSLSALGKVINCLSDFKEHQKTYIPYRDSKLTRILQQSLGGNTKTIMIATISQSFENYEETLSTLIYASRAKFIQNKPILNEDPKDVLLRQYVQQILNLKMLLLQKQLQNQGLRKTSMRFNTSTTLIKHQFQPINELQQSKFNEEYENNRIEEDQLKKKLESLENIVKKEEVDQETERKELEKIELLKKKIKLQEEREIQLQRQKRKREEELQSIEKNYNNLNEEVDILRNRYSTLKERYTLKEQEIQDFRRQYNEEREDFNFVLKEKDRQIKKLQKLLQTVLEEQTYKQIVDEDQSLSDNQSSHPSQNKFISKLNVQNKAKVNFNQSNLYKSISSEKFKEKSSYQTQSDIRAKANSQRNFVEARNYESEHEKKVQPTTKLSSSSYANMKSVKDAKSIEKQKEKERQRQKQIEKQKELLRKASIKKVDSMISLKSLKKQPLKLPFITQVKKLSSPKKIESQASNTQKSEYASKISLDIARIKDQIINELKSKAKAR